MENHSSTVAGGREVESRAIPWETLEERTPAAFTLAGVSLVASTLAPVGLQTVTDWAWVAGLVLAGVAVIAVAAGLFGLYPSVRGQAPRLGIVGVVCGAVAGVAALGLVAMAGVALVGEGAFGMDLGKPVGVFVVVTLSMASGVSLGFLSVGIAGWRTHAISRTTSRLLLLGGAVLLVPIAGELLRQGLGVAIGIPPWVFLPALAVVTLDTLALGYNLGTCS